MTMPQAKIHIFTTSDGSTQVRTVVQPGDDTVCTVNARDV
jgi:hypothetical protein